MPTLPLLLALPLAFALPQDAPTDAELVTALEEELRADPGVRADAIEASAIEGVARLEGRVESLYAKERAATLAETLRGVRSVVNLLEVEPRPAVSDEELLAGVADALFEDPATARYELDAVVDQGVVRLTGRVPSPAVRELAGTVAKGVRGARELQNDIAVEPRERRSSEALAAQLRQRLRWDPLIDDAQVTVTVEDGVATLTGLVGSAAEKRRARERSQVAGVRRVEDAELLVARWARDEDLRGDKYAERADAEIEQAIEAGLRVHPRVITFHVEAAVDDGVATLRGTVDHLEARRAAAQVARRTVGVSGVRDLVKVRPTGNSPDARIAGRVSAALQRDSVVSRYDVVPTVRGGVAYLTGAVDSQLEKARADELAARVEGVTDVVNLLQVSAGTYAPDPYVDSWSAEDLRWYRARPRRSFSTDAELRQAIERELEWSPFLGAEDITVRVSAGEATLEGRVDTWLQWTLAAAAAYEAGASEVANRVSVGPSD